MSTNTELRALAEDLMELHKESTPGKWCKGRTTHETVSTQEDRPPYLIANFHHAKDASFVDACHEHLPTLIEELRRLAEVEAELAAIKAQPVAWIDAKRVKQLREGYAVTTTLTTHVAFPDDVALYALPKEPTA